jgi:16S rRNA (guanine1516-N2)-methyltransferase
VIGAIAARSPNAEVNDIPRPPAVDYTSARVVVVASVDAARPAAAALARKLDLPLGEFTAAVSDLRLIQSESDLSLHDPHSGARLRVEFTASLLRRFRGRRDPLRRAIGAGARDVVDATAGLGVDAVHLVAAGHRVTAIERNPIVSALAQDGLGRARAQGLIEADNPRWLIGDAGVLLARLEFRPATIYLDPMFPPKRKKSAAVRKEMGLLRRLGIDDGDAAELLAVALVCSGERVVVKRPIDAPALADGVVAAYRGKLVRYDVYRSRDARA